MKQNNYQKHRKITDAIIKIVLVFAMFFAIVNLYQSSKPPFTATDLYPLKVTANKKMETHSGRYATYGYSFATAEYKARFTIENCVNFTSDRSKIVEITTGDSLEIEIDKYFADFLAAEEMEIPVYALAVNNNIIFSADTYLAGQKKQNTRKLIIFILGAAFISLLIFDIKQKKRAWAVFATLVIICIILMEMKTI